MYFLLKSLVKEDIIKINGRHIDLLDKVDLYLRDTISK